jgi:gas vesicle structural protein
MTVAMHSANRAPRPSSLADVLDIVLDKGIVIDAYVRLAVVGIEILTLDARIVIASVDTYLRFAEAVNRLDLQPQEQATGLPGLVNELRESGAKRKTRGALAGVRETASEVASSFRGGEDQEEEEPVEERRRAPAKRAAARPRRRRSAEQES